LRALTKFGTLSVPEYDWSNVIPGFLSRARASSIASSPATAALPDPQLDEHRIVVGNLISDGFVGLAVSDLTEGRAIDQGQDPPLDDNIINELGERIVPAADGHLLSERGEIGVRRLAIVYSDAIKDSGVLNHIAAARDL
jgi:hypothetical protein